MLENTAIGITGAEVFLNIWKNTDLLVVMSGEMVFSEKKWIQDVSTSSGIPTNDFNLPAVPGMNTLPMNARIATKNRYLSQIIVKGGCMVE